MNDKKRLVLLGSTGSIGTQTLDVAEKLGYPVLALAAHHRVTELAAQVRRYRPAYAAMFDEAAAQELKSQLRDTPVKVLAGMDGLCTLAALPQADVVLNAVVGMVGLLPTLSAIEAGHDVALANKETLVAGGSLVTDAVRRKGVRLLPVDSEHSAIFQCLQGAPPNRALRRVILTASGGPFFGKTAEQLQKVTPAEALRHPNWSMGAKITIDSATMMNKGLELIEARWLFDVPPDAIDIVVHRESVVHSLVEYDDCSTIAQLGVPDMRIPIQYALTYPNRVPSPVPSLSLADYGKLTFYPPDDEAFPCMRYCRAGILRGGLYPAALNGANEQAVALFLQEKIGFLDIPQLVGAMLDRTLPPLTDVQSVLRVDEESRAWVKKQVMG